MAFILKDYSLGGLIQIINYLKRLGGLISSVQEPEDQSRWGKPMIEKKKKKQNLRRRSLLFWSPQHLILIFLLQIEVYFFFWLENHTLALSLCKILARPSVIRKPGDPSLTWCLLPILSYIEGPGWSRAYFLKESRS